ncbi:hypothetical protein CHS0354_008468 [Potamilus streckersoni]|uniref:Anti-proliferative protein domain-containing protein n=1 Tax=Potamilus streckersoni TaxID=2493646 RepID=A0AAE0RPS5_9BIVA|nr:hypothetical protein CHS0354_008468 [Potamilus streckersoni]
MIEEIASAVVFMSRLIRLNVSITKEKAQKFSDHMAELLWKKFRNHWCAENPQKGQAYRCIRITSVSPVDPLLNEAATLSGLNYSDLRLPTELTLWIDPQEVSCSCVVEMTVNVQCLGTVEILLSCQSYALILSDFQKRMIVPVIQNYIRFGETHGASCMLTSFKDGKLQTYAHRVDIRELVDGTKKAK